MSMEKPLLESFMEEEEAVSCGSYGRRVRKEVVVCGTFGYKVIGDSVGESTFEYITEFLLSESRPPHYHRTTSVSSNFGRGLQIVECSQPSWIAVKGKDYTCVVYRDTPTEVMSPKPDVDKILTFNYPSQPSNAEVSVILDTNEYGGGNGIADSFAEYREERAIRYLCERLKERPALTYEQTLQTAISAYGRLFLGNINANEVKICVRRNNMSSICKSKGPRRHNRRIGMLPISKVKALLKHKSDNLSCPKSWSMEPSNVFRGEVFHEI